MKSFGQRENVSLKDRFRNTFKPRDIFLHDGRSLRRITVGSKVQMAATTAAVALVGWCGFATTQFAVAMNSDVATMQRQVAEMEADVAAIRAEAEQRAEVMAERIAFLNGINSGDADSDALRAVLPAAVGDPSNEAAQAVSAAYSELDGMQLQLVERAHAETRQRYAHAVAVVRRLGLDPSRLAGGVGGPFEEAGADAGDAGENVDPRFLELFSSWRQLEQLEQGIASIPSIMPVRGIRFTSGFGVRSDPFRSRAAMHAGVDLAGPLGTPIYATADGVVGRSEWAGGYGNLIELEHGQGIATRYGHLTRSVVRAGERVTRGQLIGHMGSTGRSTGSHLHYEVRIDGRAVNPVPFMQSGEALAALQRRGSGAQGGSR